MKAWLLALLVFGAQDSRPEPRTLMCKRGALVLHEKFEGHAFPKDWHQGKGQWVVENGILKGAEVPEDKHQAYASRKVAESNAIIQFSFKLDGARLVGAFFNGKEKAAALSISADSVRLFRIPSWTLVGSAKAKLDDKDWHTLVWEVYGDEMVATVDDKVSAAAKVEGLLLERDYLELNTRGSGGQWGLFKDVKVWKAEPDGEWPQRRAALTR
jgi:hypothetical protein